MRTQENGGNRQRPTYSPELMAQSLTRHADGGFLAVGPGEVPQGEADHRQ